MKDIIIFGIGDFARTLYLHVRETYNIIGFCIDGIYFNENKFFMNKPIFKVEDLSVNSKSFYLLIAIGYKNMRARKEKFLELKKKGFKFTNYIHSSVILLSKIQGENNIIFPGVIIEPGVKIGSNNVIWSKVLLCHDTKIGNHNFLASGCIIGGFSNIDDNNFIGFNSTIIQKIKIKKEVLIGAGTLVNKNPVDYTKNYGIPMKEISAHRELGIIIEE